MLSGTEKLNWLGQTLRSWPLPEHLSFHHDAQELQNGHLIVAVTDRTTTVKTASGEMVTSVEDAIVEVDPAGEVIEYWDLREFLDVDRQTVSNRGADWAHVNTIAFDESRDALYVSSRYQGVMVLVGRHAAGDPVTAGKSLSWVFAPHLGWGAAGAEGELGSSPVDALLTATDRAGTAYDLEVQANLSAPPGAGDDFHWPIGQHGLLVEREGQNVALTTFNNQASFIFDGPDSIDNGSTFTQWGDLANDRSAQPYSAVVRYSIDEEAKTVSEEFSFGADMSEFYGSFNGGVKRMKSTGNLLTNSNGSSQHEEQLGLNNHIVELTAEGAPIYHLEIVNPTISAYRAGRLVFYRPLR